MTNTATPQVVSSYLAQLESALRGVDPVVGAEIIAGIREELDGLSAADAAARIEELGDPAFIAAEARGASPAPDVAAVPAIAATEPGHGYAIFAVMFMIIGSIIIPVLGGVIGLGLVVQSRVWSKRERLVAFLVPVVAVAIVVAVSAIVDRIAASQSAGGAQSPLLPFGASSLVIIYPVLVLVFAVEGFVLMARGYGRGWRR